MSSDLPSVEGHEIADLLKALLVSVVRVFADWHRSNYDDTRIGTLTIGEVGGNGNTGLD